MLNNFLSKIPQTINNSTNLMIEESLKLTGDSWIENANFLSQELREIIFASIRRIIKLGSRLISGVARILSDRAS